MPPIDIDLSPLLINRTAVFNIGRDVATILADAGEFDLRYRFFGQRLAERPDPETSQLLLARLYQARAAAAADRLHGWLPPAGDHRADRWPDPGRALVLDPLYVLFAPLSPHDIVLCHDLSTLTHPQWHEPVVNRLYHEAFRRILDVGPRLIMNSQNTADTFYANFGAYRNSMTVIPLYPAGLAAQIGRIGKIEPLQPASPYFLFVGSLEARKNIIGAIEAFAASCLSLEDYRLYIVGGIGHGAAAIERRAAEVPGVALRGYLTEEALASMYAAATGFIYPSYLEGFGVPLLEAMACGVPCIATTAGASPEVGGPLVLYRDPDDITGMAQDLRTLARLTPAERQRISTGLRQRARSEFSFTQFADRLLAAVRAAQMDA